MHPIKRQILHQLALSTVLHFAQLKPERLESNIFIYHLKQLISAGLVVKNSQGTYELTPEGKSYVEYLSFQNYQPRKQPTIVTLIQCLNDQGEILLFKRKFQPYLGLIGFPYGKLHFGEEISKAVERELKEKTGLTANFKHKGEIYITMYENSNLITHSLNHLFLATSPNGKLKQSTEAGEYFWRKIMPETINSSEFMPGFLDILDLFSHDSPNLTFKELTYHL